MSYLPCELHCHTIHSDGNFKTTELMSVAKSDGLSLIALTDHNTFSGCEELDDKIIPSIKGIEWTTYFGHMLVLGAEGFVDWRDATPDNIDEKIKQLKAQKALIGVAHPFQHGSPICTGGRWEFNVGKWDEVDYIEIWHRSFIDNTENDRAVEMWTSLLDKGYKIAASYGRDWHKVEKDGLYGCTYIDFDDCVDEKQAINSIKNGRTVVSMGAKFYFQVCKDEKVYSIGDTIEEGEAKLKLFVDTQFRRVNQNNNDIEYKTIKIVTNGGKILFETDYTQSTAHLLLEKGSWYRAELWGEVNGESRAVAITSPIYCR